jgi:multiple sugar transport system substrate-binding protein
MGSEQISRRSILRGIGVGGALLTVAPMASACGGGGASSEGGIRFWWNPSVESSDQMIKWMNGVIADFESSSGASVESVIQPPEQLATNFRTACQSKTGPSLAHQYSGPYTMQFVWENCVAPLDDLVPAEETSHILPSEALTLYEYEDATYAMPWYNAPVCIMYNKALFKQAGLDPERPPATQAELIEAAQKLRSADITPWTYGVKNLTGIGNFAGMFATQDLDDTREVFPVVLGEESYTDPRYSGWLASVQELIDAEVFNPDVTSLEYTDAMNAFLARKCAMAITSSLLQFTDELGEDLGVMAPPAVGSGALAGKVHFNPHPLFVTSFAEDPQVAADLLAELHTEEALNGMYKATGFFPADDRFDPGVLTTPQDETLWDLMENQSTIGYQNYWPSIMDRENLFLAVQGLFSGDTPEQAAAGVEERLAGWRESSARELENFQTWSQSQT